MALLEIQDLKVHFHTEDGVVKAVDGASFSVEKGQTLGHRRRVRMRQERREHDDPRPDPSP